MRTILVALSALAFAGCSATVYHVNQGTALVIRDGHQIISVGSDGQIHQLWVK